ncbi:hypothetical protein [Rhizosaccharibacter radicis]|uniref:Uncharacterized protein n=1 Tax=Rhizosaccharibacter radicis TaxID=2782605 RepID=A0ABT1W199_9PROT|nr:hypothetical protein [Acetobacteraceae bacterium KSS12]
MAIGSDPEHPSTTEDVPAAPGWVEAAMDDIRRDMLPDRPAVRGLCNGYLDCLATAGNVADLDSHHDRCRRRFLDGLREDGALSGSALTRLEQRLEALEADITARIA